MAEIVCCCDPLSHPLSTQLIASPSELLLGPVFALVNPDNLCLDLLENVTIRIDASDSDGTRDDSNNNKRIKSDGQWQIKVNDVKDGWDAMESVSADLVMGAATSLTLIDLLSSADVATAVTSVDVQAHWQSGESGEHGRAPPPLSSDGRRDSADASGPSLIPSSTRRLVRYAMSCLGLCCFVLTSCASSDVSAANIIWAMQTCHPTETTMHLSVELFLLPQQRLR